MEKRQENYVVSEILHYNKMKETYKTLKLELSKDGKIFLIIREGLKGGESKSIVISLTEDEVIRLAKEFEVLSEELIKNRFRK